MEVREKLDFVKSVPLFEKLTQEEARMIADSSWEKTLPPKSVFMRQDDKSDVIYLVIRGVVRVYLVSENGEEINLAILGPREIVGEMSLMEEKQCSANVQSVQVTEVLVLKKSDLVRILSSHPDMAIKLLTTLCERMRTTNVNIEEIVTQELKDRVWRTLNILANYFPNKDIILSQEELAAIVGATRPRVTEVLDNLQNQKKLTLTHRKIHLI